MILSNIHFCLIGLLVLLFTSCDENKYLPPANTNAYISFINTSPFLGNDDSDSATAVKAVVAISGVPASEEMLIWYPYIYPAPNKYLPFHEGNGTIIFRNSADLFLNKEQLNIRAGSYYTALLAGAEGDYSTVVVDDNYKAVPGKALIRIMHFSPDAGDLTLFRDMNPQPGFDTLHYREVTAYTPVEPGNNFSFILRRSDSGHQRVGRYFVSNLEAGAAYTILLKGFVNVPDGDLANKSSQIVFYRN